MLAYLSLQSSKDKAVWQRLVLLSNTVRLLADVPWSQQRCYLVNPKVRLAPRESGQTLIGHLTDILSFVLMFVLVITVRSYEEIQIMTIIKSKTRHFRITKWI